MNQLSSEEFFELTRELEKHHAVFYKLWQIGKPLFVENTKTAYVQFDKQGECILFGINKEFWDNCSLKKKAFVICHECLHIIFNHGIRIGKGGDLGNVAADIVINNELIRTFGFNREEIEGHNDLCWVDTVFKDKKDKSGNEIKGDENLEHYYTLLKEANYESKMPNMLDDHGNFGSNSTDGTGSESEEGIKNITDALQDMLTNDEKESLRDSLSNCEPCEAGKSAGNMWKFMFTKYVPPKKKWETVIKNWCMKQIKDNLRDVEQWTRTNRRFTFLDKELILPTEMEIDEVDNEKDKIKVWFFLDTSGSCSGLSGRFWKAARSLPEDKFDVQLYCFDTNVYKVDVTKGKLYGFGGTSFSIIESYIQKHCNGEYPKAVFLITDGYGDNVNPKYPERWHWFLSTNYRSCINQKCHVHMLDKFE